MVDPSEHASSGTDVDVDVQREHLPRHTSRYSVIFHNDDYTTMEFVVLVLMEYFSKTETEATRVMLEVHHKGHGVAGTYVRDIAETKADMVEAHARAQGHPLKCTVEPLDNIEESSD